MADITDFQVGQGETFSITLQIQNVSGSVTNYLDITDYTFEGQVRENYQTDEIAAEFTITKDPAPQSGSLTVALTPTQTALLDQREYVYDVKMSSNDSPPVVRRILEGGLYVRPASTR